MHRRSSLPLLLRFCGVLISDTKHRRDRSVALEFRERKMIQNRRGEKSFSARITGVIVTILILNILISLILGEKSSTFLILPWSRFDARRVYSARVPRTFVHKGNELANIASFRYTRYVIDAIAKELERGQHWWL